MRQQGAYVSPGAPQPQSRSLGPCLRCAAPAPAPMPTSGLRTWGAPTAQWTGSPAGRWSPAGAGIEQGRRATQHQGATPECVCVTTQGARDSCLLCARLHACGVSQPVSPPAHLERDVGLGAAAHDGLHGGHTQPTLQLSNAAEGGQHPAKQACWETGASVTSLLSSAPTQRAHQLSKHRMAALGSHEERGRNAGRTRRRSQRKQWNCCRGCCLSPQAGPC